MVFDMCKMAGLRGVQKESGTAFAAQNRPDLKMDITIADDQLIVPLSDENGCLITSGRDYHLGASRRYNGVLPDASGTDETRSSYAANSSKERGSAAAKRTSEKFNHYRPHFDAASYTLFPGVLELSGGSSKHLQMFISVLAKYESAKSEDAYPVSACVSKWRQRDSQ